MAQTPLLALSGHDKNGPRMSASERKADLAASEAELDLDPKKLTPVVRAIAALANNKGGYVLFGLSD